MKPSYRMIAVAIAVGIGSPVVAAPTPIGMAKARTIALKVAPGHVEKAEYEKEGGRWRYSFDIRQGRRIHEIGVDAHSGRIVENAFEQPGARD